MVNMNKEFIPHEQALELKELGFDEYCFKTSWDFDIADKVNVGLPLYQQAFRWFRENHKLYSFVFVFDEGFGYETYKEGVTQTNESFNTYEEAELDCLKKLIEMVKLSK